MKTIYTRELVEQLCERLNGDPRSQRRSRQYSKAEARDILDIVQETLAELLVEPDRAVVLHGFGKLYTAASKPREVKSNLTGETHQVGVKRKIRFRPSVRLEETINDH